MPKDRRLARVATRLAVVACFIAAIVLAKPVLRWLDIHVAAEAGKDAIARLTGNEDWSFVQPLQDTADYSWLDHAGVRPLVAHALGEASLPGQNTLSAMESAISGGLRLLEVDLWLDDQGRLRCHHGPQPPAPWQAGDCEFARVLQRATATGAWVVPDLKTDFAATGDAVMAQLRSDEDARHLVFQLYRPDDMRRFQMWSRQRPLAGPIVTGYLARRSLNHVARHAARAGIRALAVPLYRRTALSALPPGMKVLVHPVHDCHDLRDALPGDGLYMRTALLPSLDRGCPG